MRHMGKKSPKNHGPIDIGQMGPNRRFDVSPRGNFNEFLAMFKNFLKIMEDDVKKKLDPGNKEFERWKRIDIKGDQERFCMETMYVHASRILLAFVFRDKGLISFHSLDPQEDENQNDLIKRIYSDMDKFCPRLSSTEIFNWYLPNNYLVLKLIGVLDNYDFSKIERDILGELYEQFITIEERKRLGQFYTPDEVVDYILSQIGYTSESEIIGKRLIDISCGSGRFLTRAANILINKLKKSGEEPHKILKVVKDSIYGFDINPFACYLCETNLILLTIEIILETKKNNPKFVVEPFNVYQTNSLILKGTFFYDTNEMIQCIKQRTGNFKDGFDFVVGNPPYIEAKTMPSDTKEICRSNFPETAKGGFDIFICFIKMGMNLLKERGRLGYIIPNKFTVANYSISLREEILDKFSINEIIDVSDIEVFNKTAVYPIIFIIQKSKNSENNVNTAAHVRNLDDLVDEKFDTAEISQKAYLKNELRIFFTIPANKIERGLITKILESPFENLSEFLDVKWTISFHKEGLREHFLFPTKSGEFPKKILGSADFEGNSDVQRYSINWSGWYIDYDEEKARQLKNQLPPKEIFETEKLIICQNTKTLRATYDDENYYAKDIFFVASLSERAKKENVDIKFLLGVLNSKFMSYYYSVIFKGTHVGGSYLHFLVGYLNSLPIQIDSELEKKIVALVDKMLSVKVTKEEKEKFDRNIDGLICKLYNINKKEKEMIEKKYNMLEKLGKFH